MKIKKRKRKKFIKFNNISIICCTLIILLGITGVSYSYWNDNLNVITQITTGSIEPYFKTNDDDFPNEFKLVGNDKGDLDIEVTDDKIIITGNITSGYNDNLFFYVSNRGSVPVVCESIENPNPKFFQQINTTENLIEANNKNKVKGKLHIKPEEEGTYNFNFDFPIKQYNKGGWQKKLSIDVNNVIVTNPPPPSIDTTTSACIEVIDGEPKEGSTNRINVHQSDNVQESKLQEGNELKENHSGNIQNDNNDSKSMQNEDNSESEKQEENLSKKELNESEVPNQEKDSEIQIQEEIPDESSQNENSLKITKQDDNSSAATKNSVN